MREGDWNEIMQRPQAPLTNGQFDLLSEVNLAALTREKLVAMTLRLLIEVRRLRKFADVESLDADRLQNLVAVLRAGGALHPRTDMENRLACAAARYVNDLGPGDVPAEYEAIRKAMAAVPA